MDDWNNVFVEDKLTVLLGAIWEERHEAKARGRIVALILCGRFSPLPFRLFVWLLRFSLLSPGTQAGLGQRRGRRGPLWPQTFCDLRVLLSSFLSALFC